VSTIRSPPIQRRLPVETPKIATRYAGKEEKIAA
jgi:hypothetical protein